MSLYQSFHLFRYAPASVLRKPDASATEKADHHQSTIEKHKDLKHAE